MSIGVHSEPLTTDSTIRELFHAAAEWGRDPGKGIPLELTVKMGERLLRIELRVKAIDGKPV